MIVIYLAVICQIYFAYLTLKIVNEHPDNGIKLLHWLGLVDTMELVELSWQ